MTFIYQAINIKQASCVRLNLRSEFVMDNKTFTNIYHRFRSECRFLFSEMVLLLQKKIVKKDEMMSQRFICPLLC